MMEYAVKYVKGAGAASVWGAGAASEWGAGAASVWDSVPEARIENFPWETTDSGHLPAASASGYLPAASARMFYTDDCFVIRFVASEGHIRAVNTGRNGPVCQDSCVEFFVNPCPEKSDKYVNFEINPIGALHVGFGEGRHNRELIGGAAYESVVITPYIDSPEWRITCAVPFSFFDGLYGKTGYVSGHAMRANFYKCGDLTRRPHWACWNPVGAPSPDFHLPEFFGALVLE